MAQEVVSHEQKGMWRLDEDNLIPEVKNVKLENCTDCLPGKQN